MLIVYIKPNTEYLLSFYITQPYNYVTKIGFPAIANDMKELNTYLCQ